MPEFLAVGLEMAAVILSLGTTFVLAGYGLTRILAPPSLRAQAVLVIPLTGLASLIIGTYLLNLVVDVRVSTAVLLLAATGLAAWTVRRDGWWWPKPTTGQTIVLIMGALLLSAALLPHLHSRSPSMLSLNIDEDLYVPLAEALKSNTMFMHGLKDGPFQTEFQGIGNRSRGWGFPYLLAIGSIIANVPTFHTYAPVLYLLLAFSVPSLFVFVRAGLGLSERTALLAAFLYTVHGLPLWFAEMGFGPHTVSFALFPIAAATGTIAIQSGGRRTIGLASVTSAALLVSYFWAISAVYVAVAIVLAASFLLVGPNRINILKRSGALVVGIAALGAPGISWLLIWAVPQIISITSNLHGRFGNAWNDTTFANIELAFGLEPYRLIPRDGPLESLLGSNATATLSTILSSLFWPSLAVAVIGLFTLRGNRQVAIAIAVGFAGFMWWVAVIAGYQYGHLKNLSYVAFLVVALMASGLSNLYRARFNLWNDESSKRLTRWLTPAQPSLQKITVGMTLILSFALIHNTYLSVWWNWQGVGWNFERRVAHDARAVAQLVPEGSRVAFAHALTYPVPEARQRISNHELGFHFPKHQTTSWTSRTRSVWIGQLVGRSITGNARSLAFPFEDLLNNDYDFIVLNTDDDPRTSGLLANDAVYSTPYWTIYRDPVTRRLRSRDLLRSLGSLELSADTPIQLGIHEGKLAAGPHVDPANTPIVFGLVSAKKGVIWAGPHEVAIGKGMTWITTSATTDTPLEIQPVGGDFRPLLIAAALVPDDVGIAISSHQTNKQLIAVTVSIQKNNIIGSVITNNPSETGRNAGLSYNEEPLDGSSPSHGFWPSAALVSAATQRIDFAYDPLTRTLAETVNGQTRPLLHARDSEVTGRFRLWLKISRGFINDLDIPLIDYTLTKGQISNAQPFPRTYVFTLSKHP
jgi:hypothetical protein